MFAYALKMWGFATGDGNMEARGNLQLAILARSVRNYFLFENSNNVQPKNVIPNKVSGILFENKVDHTTYFGDKIEYIQGIHMLPLLPCSQLTRAKKFVQEEWDTYFSNGRVDNAENGWRAIIWGSYARVDPKAAWTFFSKTGADEPRVDGGASRTWYLVWVAGKSNSFSLGLSACFHPETALVDCDERDC